MRNHTHLIWMGARALLSWWWGKPVHACSTAPETNDNVFWLWRINYRKLYFLHLLSHSVLRKARLDEVTE